MKRSRFKDESRTRLAFRNRQEVFAATLGHVGASLVDTDYLRLIVLVGLGGTGKSRLLDEIVTSAMERYPEIVVVRISLESESAGTAIAPLKAIRDRLNFNCLLFDCAVITYWAAMGQPFRLVEGGALSKSVVVKAIEARACSTAIESGDSRGALDGRVYRP